MAKKTQTQQYEVVRRVRHNGEYYEVGDPIELTVEQAESLLGIKAIRTFQEGAQTGSKTPDGNDQTSPDGNGQNTEGGAAQ